MKILMVHRKSNKRLGGRVYVAIALALLMLLSPLAGVGDGVIESYAKGSLAPGDTVKNVLFYVKTQNGENILVSRIPVAEMVSYLNDNDEAIGKVHNYSILDNFIASVHQEAQGFTLPEFLNYAVGKSPLSTMSSWNLSYAGEDIFSFWEIDGSGFSYPGTYNSFYGTPRYNFPALYSNFISGKPAGQGYTDKEAVWASRQSEQVVLAITAFSQRHMQMDNPPADGNLENWFDNNNKLDTNKAMRVMMPMTETEFNNNTTTAMTSRWGVAYIQLAMVNAPDVAPVGVVEKPEWTAIDGDADPDDEYEAGNVYFGFTCATPGATILYNDASVPGYTPTAIYTPGQLIKVKKTAGKASLKVHSVKEGWADKGIVMASNTGGDDEYEEYVSPSADVWDGASVDTSWYDDNPAKVEFDISSAAGLAGLAKLTNRNQAQDGQSPVDFAGKTIRLTKDIHLNNKEWMPIADDQNRKQSNGGAGLDGNYVNSFKGTFDGQGHVISGINFRSERWYGENLGLFGYPSADALIKNMTLSGKDNVNNADGGSVAGNNKGTIDNVTNLMNISAESTGTSSTGNMSYVGGIAGKNSGTIKNCTNKGVLTARNSGPIGAGAGGIVGTSTTNGVLENSVNHGKVRGNSYLLGGIAASGNPVNCQNRGDVVAEGMGTYMSMKPSVGGIVGQGNPKNCINYKNITADKDGISVAGIAGGGSAEACVNYGNITAAGTATGIVGTNNGSATTFGNAKECRNYGIISGASAAGISAGFARTNGNDFVGGTVTDCLSVGDVKGNKAAGIALSGKVTGCVNYAKVEGGTEASGLVTTLLYGIEPNPIMVSPTINSSYNMGQISVSGGSGAKLGGLAANIGKGSCEKSYDMTGQSLFGAALASPAPTISNVYYLGGSSQTVSHTGMTARTAANMKIKSIVDNYLGADKFVWRSDGAQVPTGIGYPALKWQERNVRVLLNPQNASIVLRDQNGFERPAANSVGDGPVTKTYNLLLGELCSYTASMTGYITQETSLRVTDEAVLPVTLIKDMADDSKSNPVVFSGTQDNSTTRSVVWRGVGTASESVQYVPASSYASEASFASSACKSVIGTGSTLSAGDQTQSWNKAKITGLSPGSKYYYRVGKNGSWSEVHSFTTAVNKPKNFSFMYFGDVQRAGGTAEQEYPIWGSLMEQATLRNPDLAFGLSGGDMVEGGGDLTDWKYFLSYGQHAFSSIPLYPTAGNHESNFPSGKPEYMQSIFDLPQNGPTDFKGQFYSFNYGSVHVTVLNSWALSDEQGVYMNKEMNGGVKNQAKLDQINDWISSDLAAAQNSKFRVVVMHHPPYEMETDAVAKRVREQWEPLFVAGKVDLGFVAHQHAYGRTPALNGGNIDTQSGVVYIMGNSGLKSYPSGDPTYYTKQIFDTPSYQIATVTGDSLSVKSYDMDGNVLDTWSKTSSVQAVIGDVNGDGRANEDDVGLIMERVLAGGAYDEDLDANGDGKVDVRDAQYVRLQMAG